MVVKGELVRLKTQDKLQLDGLFYESDKSDTAVIHIHGWMGNFHENDFIVEFAEKYVEGGLSFLVFNNRGAGIVSDIKSTKGGYKRIGGSIENFEESIKDINAAIDFLKNRGYNKFILQGHSLGCQKIAYHQFKETNNMVKGLVLLAPVDDVGYVKRTLEDRYNESIKVARRMVKDGKSDQPVPDWMAFYPLLNARRFLDLSDTETTHGRLFDYTGQLYEIKMIKVPVLAVFGSKDDYEEEPQTKLNRLSETISDCKTLLFEGSNHWISEKEDVLAEKVTKWIQKIL